MKHSTVLVVAAGVLTFGAYSFWEQKHKVANGTPLDLAGMMGVMQPKVPVDHLADASQIDGPLITMPHQYPTTTGENITAVLFEGWHPGTMRPATDYDWYLCPPSEERLLSWPMT